VAIVDIRVLTGERFNNLETGTVSLASTAGNGVVLGTAAADPLFPLANAYDGRPSRTFRPGAKPAYPLGLGIVVDGNALINGSLETWSGGVLSSWTQSGGGTVTQTVVAGEFVLGSAAKFAGGGAPTIAQDYVVRSGQARCLDIWLRGAGGANNMSAVLQNLQTGNTLAAGGASWSPFQVVAVSSGVAYNHFQINYTVEPFSAAQAPLVTLRLSIQGPSGVATGFADELADYPAVNFVSVHGHNLDLNVAAKLYSCAEPTFAAPTLEQTAAIIHPAFYGLLPALIYRRYWNFETTPASTGMSALPELGEVVIGQTYALTQAPTYGVELGFIRDDVATETGLGEQHVYGRAKHPRRTVGLKFRFDSETKYRAARDEIYRRCGGRVNPLVIVPDTTLPDVIYGRIDRSWKVTRSLVAYYDNNDLTVAESAFPIATN
jgi:hypothetical protein